MHDTYNMSFVVIQQYRLSFLCGPKVTKIENLLTPDGHPVHMLI